MERGHHGALDEPARPEQGDDSAFDTRRLEIQEDARLAQGEELERLLERRACPSEAGASCASRSLPRSSTTSISTRSTPWSIAAWIAASVFSGASAAAPRWPMRRDPPLAQVHGGVGQRLLVELAAAGDEVDDHPVGQPLDRRAVVGEQVAVRHDRLEPVREERHERRDRAAAPSPHAAHELRASSGRSKARSSSLKRSGCQRQACGNSASTVVPIASGSRSSPGTAATLSAITPPGCEVVADEREELPRRQVERDVGLVVGVDDDDVVALVGQLEERPSVVA